MLWYIYEYTGKEEWRARAERATALLEAEQFNALDHDIGFKMYCSYGNGWRLTKNPDYTRIICRAAKTLSSRYSYKTGLIMSWEEDNTRDWQFPVIIDNMMNLKLLMEAYKLSSETNGPKYLHHMASALIELSTYSANKDYFETGEMIPSGMNRETGINISKVYFVIE